MKRNTKLTNNILHEALKKSIKKVLKETTFGPEDNLHDDIDLTSTSLDDENNFAYDDDEESEDESAVLDRVNEAKELAYKLYATLDEMCDECRNILRPSFDEYSLEDARDKAEEVMNDLDEIFEEDMEDM